MSTVLVTGSAGLIGAETVRRFHDLGWDVVGIDNDMRRTFFGPDGSTQWMAERLRSELPNYVHLDLDVRDASAVDKAVAHISGGLELVVHTAAQPSHDWAARDPLTDFTVNAQATLVVLESIRRYAPGATVIFTSTNKVYGDRPNQLPLLELETRFELLPEHEWFGGIPETMSIDQTTHSLFGVSKAAADLLVQEYGRYFGLKTVTFRGGCLTGPGHSGTELHGFLAYLMRCAATAQRYTVYGHKAKQVRDNIHSADLVWAFELAAADPRPGAVYNIGGGRGCNCSMLEAIELCERITGRSLRWDYVEESRSGDHAWWISDLGRFQRDYPAWRPRRTIASTLEEIFDTNRERWPRSAVPGA